MVFDLLIWLWSLALLPGFYLAIAFICGKRDRWVGIYLSILIATPFLFNFLPIDKNSDRSLTFDEKRAIEIDEYNADRYGYSYRYEESLDRAELISEEAGMHQSEHELRF